MPWHAWWFVLAYLQLMFISPILNLWLDQCCKYYHLLMILVVCFFNFYIGFLSQNPLFKTGFGLPNFICIYIISRYIRNYPLPINKYFYLLLYIILSIINAFIYVKVFNAVPYSGLGFAAYYNSPTIFLASASLFIFFSKLNIPNGNKFSNIILYLSSSAFSVYLISNHPFIRDNYYRPFWEYIYKTLCFHTVSPITLYIFYLLLTNIIIFITLCTVDKIRIKYLKPIQKSLSVKLESINMCLKNKIK